MSVFPMRPKVTGIAVALSCALPAAAWAQTVTLQKTGISRVNKDGSAVTTKSTTNMNVFARVNGADCYGIDDSGIEYVFPITVANETMPAAHHIELWAGGTDCSPLTARSGTSATCWPVSGSTYPPNAVVQYPRVRAQDIVSQITATQKTLTYAAALKDVCTKTTALSKVTVYFLLLDGTGNPVGTSAAWPMNVKLIGPAAPNPIGADALDRAISVHWTGSKDTDLSGYRVFVESGATADAAAQNADDPGTLVTTCADGGFDEAGDAIDGGCTTVVVYEAAAGGGTCSSASLVAGGRADQLTPAVTAGKTDTRATAQSLANGTSYAVAVAAVDAYDNTGPLSDVVCVSPEPVTDFWSRYKGAGGAAGGLCTASASPAGGAWAAIGLVLATGAWLRRRRGQR